MAGTQPIDLEGPLRLIRFGWLVQHMAPSMGLVGSTAANPVFSAPSQPLMVVKGRDHFFANPMEVIEPFVGWRNPLGTTVMVKPLGNQITLGDQGMQTLMQSGRRAKMGLVDSPTYR